MDLIVEILGHGRHVSCLFLFIFLLFSLIVNGQVPPQVAIVQPINGAVFDGDQIKVDYSVSGTAPKSMKILVDGKSVQLLTEVRIGQNTAMVDVPARDCKISIIAQNEFGASVPAVVRLKRSEYIFKPTLYIMSVGVSKYANPDLQLQFAAKDAIDFSLSMLRQHGLLYEKAELRLLTDEQANAENIRDGLHWLQTETTHRDVAMLFMAGHGINNNIGDFFFMPVNADIEKLNATCVGYREIKEMINANAGKMLVFMDACHSGNVLGNNHRRAAMLSQAISDLTSADNGAVIFTSSTGRQFSLENPDWNNGAFTKALVEGLEGKADLFNRLTITVNNLSSYVADRVKELTGGQQAPTVIIPSSVTDFPVAVVSDARPEMENFNRFLLTSMKKTVRPPIYIALSAGVSSFGTVSVGDMHNNEGATVFGADLVYFINSWLGAGVKLNTVNSKVDFGNAGAWRDQITFIGLGAYGRWAKKRLEFVAGVSVGSLRWKMSGLTLNDLSSSNQSATTAGAFLWTGVNYMITKNIGVALNAQSAIGTVKTDDGMERNPAGAGITLGVNYRF